MPILPQERIREAQRLLDAGRGAQAAAILDELVKLHVPEALYLRAHVSLPGEEDAEGFERRYVRQLREAEALGHAGATYELSVITEE